MNFGLPRSCFVCPELFRREQDLVFSRYWVCVGRLPGQQAPQPGQNRTPWFLADVGGASVIVTTSGGTVRAWHNVCRHRGTQLIQDRCGVLKNDSITCPYHAWTYNVDGRLTGAPNMLDDDEFRREEFGLLPVSAAVWGGYVFLRLNEAGPPFEQFIAPLASRLANWRIDQLQLATSIEYDVQANWKLLCQNYSECYHCPTVHPGLNQLTPYRTATNDLQEGPILGGPMQLAEDFATVTRDGRAIAAPFDGLTESQRRGVWYYTVFPGCFFSAHPDYVMVHRLIPRDIGRTAVVCDFLVHRKTPVEAIRPASEMWDEVNRQDWTVCELTQRGAASPAFQPGPYSRLETMLTAFDRHYRDVMGDALVPQPVEDSEFAN